jgi:hypothetical protein
MLISKSLPFNLFRKSQKGLLNTLAGSKIVCILRALLYVLGQVVWGCRAPDGRLLHTERTRKWISNEKIIMTLDKVIPLRAKGTWEDIFESLNCQNPCFFRLLFL